MDLGLLSSATLALSASRLLHLGMLSGAFEPPRLNPLKSIPASAIGSDAHAKLSELAATRSVTLLANRRATLPLAASTSAEEVTLIGPAANLSTPMQGSYSGLVPPRYNETLLVAMRRRFGADLTHAEGCEDLSCTSDAGFAAAAEAARGRTAVVAVGHTWRCAHLARSQADPSRRPEPACSMEGSDLSSLELPGRQEALIQAVGATAKRLVVVYVAANPVASTWVAAHADALLQAYFAGQATAAAIVAVISGDANPAGRLPFTVPRSLSEVPPMASYSMAGRGYRFATQPALWPFGYGLSFSTFAYSDLVVDPPEVPACGNATVSFTLSNTHGPSGREAPQLYAKWRWAQGRASDSPAPGFHQPPRPVLKAFRSVQVRSGGSVRVSFALGASELQAVRTDTFESACAHGELDLFVGGGQPGMPPEHTRSNGLRGTLRVGGES